MCKVLKISSSGYYYWLKHPVSLRSKKQKDLLVEIKNIYEDNKCCYGSPRITDELKSKEIFSSRPRVARLMRKANIRSVIRKSYKVQITDSEHN